MSLKTNNNKTILGAIWNTTVASVNWLNGASTELTTAYGFGNHTDAQKAGKAGKRFAKNSLGTLDTRLATCSNDLGNLVYELKIEQSKHNLNKMSRIAKRIVKVRKEIRDINAEKDVEKHATKMAKKAIKRSDRKYK